MTHRKARARPLKAASREADIVRWIERHDVFDRLKTGVAEVVPDHADLDRILEDALAQGNTVQLNMRVPPAMKAALGRLARERTTDATTLARIWLAERLRSEIGRGR
jgi:hypothetical protein